MTTDSVEGGLDSTIPLRPNETAFSPHSCRHLDDGPSEVMVKALYSKSELVGLRAGTTNDDEESREGRDLLVKAIRSGVAYNGLWWELVALVDDSSHYDVIRALWYQSPRRLAPSPASARRRTCGRGDQRAR